ncbi:MAG: helix-turn-helix transcriptional regulator [Acidobacteriota bacterium]|nr:MAG: helix-turn-helix transcriptional regulator [Acidobacteriota bacterium]
MTDPQIQALGARIRELRDAAGLSLNALAESAGVSKGYLSQLERGEAVNPGYDVLRKIAAAMALPLSTLLGEDEDVASAPRPLPPSLQEFVAKKAAEGDPVSDEALDILARMCRRGRPPRSLSDWNYLYEFLRRNVF